MLLYFQLLTLVMAFKHRSTEILWNSLRYFIPPRLYGKCFIATWYWETSNKRLNLPGIPEMLSQCFLSMFHREISKFQPQSSQPCAVTGFWIFLWGPLDGIFGMELPQPPRICLWTLRICWSHSGFVCGLSESADPPLWAGLPGFILEFSWVPLAGFQPCTCVFTHILTSLPMMSLQLVTPCLPLAQEAFIASLMLSCLFGFLGTRSKHCTPPQFRMHWVCTRLSVGWYLHWRWL